MLNHRIPEADDMPLPILGALSTAKRWEMICDGIAEVMSEGDRAARGLPSVRFSKLPQGEQNIYLRAALEACMRFVSPDLCNQARDSAILRACQVWQGDGDDPVSPAIARRMRTAWIHGMVRYHAALDGTHDPAGVAERASELALIIAPNIGRAS